MESFRHDNPCFYRSLVQDEYEYSLSRASKSMSDLSKAGKENDPLDPSDPQPETESSRPLAAGSQHSSPSHHERTYWRRKGQQLSSWWSNLKKFAPQRLARSRSKERRRKEPQSCSWLSSSHPDVSHTDLSEFVNAPDDGSHSAYASLTSSPKRRLEDPSPSGSPFLGKRPCSAGGSSAATDSASTGRHSTEPAEPSKTTDGAPLTEDVYGDSMDGTAFLKHRHALLRQHPFFELDVWLRSGQNLVARDSCGTSDPYVKFKMSGKLVYKSKTVHKNLNPDWNERFIIPVEDVFQPLQVKVFDYDWGLQDDFMGSASFDLSNLEMYQPTDVTLELSEPGKMSVMGSINVVFTLIPRSQEDKEQVISTETFEMSFLSILYKRFKPPHRPILARPTLDCEVHVFIILTFCI